MFGAVGMWIAWAGMRVVARGAHVRLGATGGPPTIRKLFGLAHFHAATADFGFRAVAIAAARGGGT